ncbi:hypothetical protein HDV05_002651, partial [Chytridiales sp. JEL 0842]
MENGTNKEEILADDMVMGKTVQSIGTIVMNRNEPWRARLQDDAHRSTDVAHSSSEEEQD